MDDPMQGPSRESGEQVPVPEGGEDDDEFYEDAEWTISNVTSAISVISEESDDDIEEMEIEEDSSWLTISSVKGQVFPCQIPSCGASSDKLLEASIIAKTYFGLAATGKRFLICVDCQKKAELFLKESIKNLKKGRSLFSVETNPQETSLTVDLTSENNACTPSGSLRPNPEMVEFNQKDLDACTRKMLSRFNIAKQIKKCTEDLKQEIKKLEQEIHATEKDINKQSDKVIDSYFLYNRCFGPKKVQSWDVGTDTNGDAVTRSPAQLFPSGCARMRPNWNADIQILHEVINLEDQPEDDDFPEILNSSDENSESDEMEQDDRLCDLPTDREGAIRIPVRLPELQGADIIALCSSSTNNCWIPARYIERSPSTSFNLDCPIYHIVQFGENPGVKEELPLKRLAYPIAPEFVVPRTVRIVAKLGSVITKLESKKCNCPKTIPHYIPGIIADANTVNKTKNSKSKYVVFFEDGQIGNVAHRDVRIILGGKKKDFLKLRNENYPETNGFAKDVIEKNLHRVYKLRLNCTGDINVTWCCGMWMTTRVTRIDGEMLRVGYHNGKTKMIKQTDVPIPCYEWIFSGSPRFLKNFQQYFKSLPSDKIEHLEGFEGIVKKIKLSNPSRPKNLDKHKCSKKCGMSYDSSLHPKGISPLAIPLYFGWERSTGKGFLSHYITPCGRTRRNYDEILQYLQEADSNLHVDWFCFNSKISCVNKFKPENGSENNLNAKKYQDISNGKEKKVPVEAVNLLINDREPLPSFTYEDKCIVDSGVNKPVNFVVCCDCTDGCIDTSKCACLKRTLEWTKELDQTTPGYSQRKLGLRVEPAIFECNLECTCKQETCSNRVVQNGLQWPLQVFKTRTKGWAVRTMCDIPRGSFVCEYAGKVLTDEVGTEEGKRNGDDYLLDLTFIKRVERIYQAKLKQSPESNNESDQPQQNEMDDECFSGDEHGEKWEKGECNKKGKSFPFMQQIPTSEEQDFVINPKQVGNVGRFFSHSCSPNMFVQEVFVDTHDIRFPILAFFTSVDVFAGTELTWDYCYVVGSVPGKEIMCECGSSNCRGRLL